MRKHEAWDREGSNRSHVTDRAVTSAHVTRSGVKCKRSLESQNFNTSLTFCLVKRKRARARARARASERASERERERERERRRKKGKKKKERKREQARKEKR